MACEKCWNDAYLRWMANPGKPQADHYTDLLLERKDNPCTPEQQKRGNDEIGVAEVLAGCPNCDPGDMAYGTRTCDHERAGKGDGKP